MNILNKYFIILTILNYVMTVTLSKKSSWIKLLSYFLNYFI
jgi:hypothetical protein